MARTGMQLPMVRQIFGMDLDPKKQVSLVSKEPRILRSCMVPSTANVALAGREDREAIKTLGTPTASRRLLGSPTSDGCFCPVISALFLEKEKWARRESRSPIAHRSRVTVPRERGPNVFSLQTGH